MQLLFKTRKSGRNKARGTPPAGRNLRPASAPLPPHRSTHARRRLRPPTHSSFATGPTAGEWVGGLVRRHPDAGGALASGGGVSHPINRGPPPMPICSRLHSPGWRGTAGRTTVCSGCGPRPPLPTPLPRAHTGANPKPPWRSARCPASSGHSRRSRPSPPTPPSPSPPPFRPGPAPHLYTYGGEPCTTQEGGRRPAWPLP